MDALEDFIPAASPTASSAWATSSRSSSAPRRPSTPRRRAKIAEKMKKGEFDLEDLADQLKQMQKIGGMYGIIGMMPGIGKMKKQIAAAGLDEKPRAPARHHLVDDAERAAQAQAL